MHHSLFGTVRSRLVFAILVGVSVISLAQQPNVVFIITDDQGYGDVAAHGNPIIQTPAIDALHASSVRLTDYHVSPTCSPTRAITSCTETSSWLGKQPV